eukprot:m.152402 g.152402  ORF g.152402 m.152402 type:complete len:161 (+) comp16210_c1_seq28:52-534(+)
MSTSILPSSTVSYVIRLRPNQEIVTELSAFITSAGLRAAFIQTCVGSVKAGELRLAHATAENRNEMMPVEGCHEIVSLVGTLFVDEDGTYKQHLHASLSDKDGKVIGGHVMSLVVFTTAEIVIGECQALAFSRPHDPETGFDELVIAERQEQPTGDETKQ